MLDNFITQVAPPTVVTKTTNGFHLQNKARTLRSKDHWPLL